MWSGASSHEDPDRVLQGRRSARGARTHHVRLPELYLPTTTSEESLGKVFCELSAGDQYQGGQGDPCDHPRMADGVHQEQPALGGSRAARQPGGAGVAELLRAVLPFAVYAGAPPSQRGPRGVGATEVQAVPAPRTGGDALAGTHRATGTAAGRAVARRGGA